MSQEETLAVTVSRIEGKLDLGKAQSDHLQATLTEIKAALREDRIGSEQRLKDHVEAVNPHPAQEAWLRSITAGHDTRLKALETDHASDQGHDRAVRWLVGVAVTEGLALAGLLVQIVNLH